MKRLGRDRTLQLLDEFCTVYGICIREADRERMIEAGHVTPDAFARALFRAEGLDVRESRELFDQVCHRLAREFSRGSREAIVSAARGLLTGSIGVLEAARILASIQSEIDPALEDNELTTFLAIDGEAAIDEDLEGLAAFHLERARHDALILIHRYDAVP
jgi:hypothetical protein